MVLALGLLLFGSALLAAAPAKPSQSTPESGKSFHKSAKSITKSDKPAHSLPSAGAKVATASSRPGASRLAARARTAAYGASAQGPAAGLSTARTSAQGLKASATRNRAETPLHASGPSAAGRDASGRATGRRGFRTKAQTRSAVLTSRRRRASLRNGDADEPQSFAPASEVVSLHRRDLGLSSPLRGSFASLERQNEISEGEDGLERIQDEGDLEDRIAHNFLVPVPTSANLTINQNLADTHRYCRPWTAQFLTDLSRQHAARFHSSLEVSSAVRTVDYQKQLQRTNGNATAAEGDVASPHLTGAAVDIPKSNMTRDEIAWMRTSLLALQQAGKLDVEEEFRQSCFHITVYKSYTGQPTAAPPTNEAVNLADEPAPPIDGSAAPVNGPVIAPAVARTHSRSRHSKHAVAKAARAVPA